MEKFTTVALALTLLLQPTSANATLNMATARPSPSLPSELDSQIFSVNQLREKLYEPLYIDASEANPTTPSPPSPSDLESAMFFVGGQGAINSQLSNVQITRIDENTNTYICEGYQDPICQGQLKTATVILPVCSDYVSEKTACIESFGIRTNGTLKNGVKTGYVNNDYHHDLKAENFPLTSDDGNPPDVADDGFWDKIDVVDHQDVEVWAGNALNKWPRASSPSKWSIDGVNNSANVNTYMLNARITFTFIDGEPIEYSDFTLDVVPYREISGNTYHPPYWITRDQYLSQSDRDAKTNREYRETFPSSASKPLSSFDNPQQSQHLTCAFEEINSFDLVNKTITNSTCGVAVNFADNSSKVEVSLRLPNELGGWFHGRLSDTQIELTDAGEQHNTFRISAAPVNVPISSYQIEICHPEFSSHADYTFEGAPTGSDKQWFCQDRPKKDGLGSLGIWDPKSSRAVTDFTKFEEFIDERAKGQINIWSVGTLPFDQAVSNCFSNASQVQGFISTNAMVYQAGVPTYSNGKFNYRIASTHLDADANVIRGDYTLVVRTSVARCLWGFGNGEISGSVQVTGASNEEKSSTTTISISPEWIRITAIGFTFSESNVALSLSEKKNVTGSAKSTLPPTLGSKSRTTIANVAKLIGVEAPAKSRYFISISKESRKVCRFDNGRLLAVKAGNCTVTVTALAPKPKLVRLNGAIQNVESTTLTKQQLVEKLGRTWVPKSAVTISVSKNSRQACYVKGGKLVVKPNSNCEYRLVLSEPRPKPVRVSGTIQVN